MEVVKLYTMIGFLFVLVINFYGFRELFYAISRLWRKFVHFLLDDPS